MDVGRRRILKSIHGENGRFFIRDGAPGGEELTSSPTSDEKIDDVNKVYGIALQAFGMSRIDFEDLCPVELDEALNIRQNEWQFDYEFKRIMTWHLMNNTRSQKDAINNPNKLFEFPWDKDKVILKPFTDEEAVALEKLILERAN